MKSVTDLIEVEKRGEATLRWLMKDSLGRNLVVCDFGGDRIEIQAQEQTGKALARLVLTRDQMKAFGIACIQTALS